MVGNGIMTFVDDDIQRAEVDFMIGRGFVDPLILPYYDYACQFDPKSAGCRYFNIKFAENV